MDFSILLSLPVISALAVMVLLAVWSGYVIEKSRQTSRKEKTYVDEIQRLGDEHSVLVKELNEANIANINAMNKEHETQLAAVREEAAREISGLQAETGELTDTISELKESIKEAKMQNMFSVSKSGEQLIRVVRSVQELAVELNETSKTVTGGEHSFFDEIKDQRDKETVLSLTGFDKQELVPDYETDQEAAIDEPEEDGTEKGEDETVSMGGFDQEELTDEPDHEPLVDVSEEGEMDAGEDESGSSMGELDKLEPDVQPEPKPAIIAAEEATDPDNNDEGFVACKGTSKGAAAFLNNAG